MATNYQKLKKQLEDLKYTDPKVTVVEDEDGKKVSSKSTTKTGLKERLDSGDLIPTQSRLNDIKASKNTSSKKKSTWFDTGAFDDGYDFGDITKTILGTATDVYSDAGKGVARIGEAVWDTGAYAIGGAAKIFGNDKLADNMEKFISKNIVEELGTSEWATNLSPIGLANNIVNGNLSVYKPSNILETGKKFTTAFNIDENRDMTKTSLQDSKFMEANSLLGDKSDSLVQSAGQLGGTIALQAAGVPWWVTTGVTSFAGGVEEGFNNDATYGQAGFSGLVNAGAEILTEKLSGGISFGGKTLDAGLKSYLTKGISNKVVNTLAQLGIDMAGEGAEEVVSEVIQNIGKKLSYENDKTWSEVLASEDAMQSYIDSFIGGAALGGAFNVGKATSSIKTGRNYDTGLTTNEQKVVDTETTNRVNAIEKETNKKLSKKEVQKISEEVRNDLDKGYISTDTIESTLGGEQYSSYKTVLDKQTNIENEIKQLENKPYAEMTVKENERLQALREELKTIDTNTLRDNLKSSMNERISSDGYLQRSYVENANRSNKFEADINKYDAKQRKTIQNAIDSGILNNTNRTHDFVDMVAKLSADKGIDFNFTNNENLKNSGFAVDGKQVNGFVNKNGVTVNIDSNNSLNSVVGHEITHVLEGTELYTELQNAVKEYATTKGVYDTKLAELTEMYKNVDNANIENELTSDLVGEYLFSDTDFVNNLSTTKPNVFKKIYNEIKYMLKVATAGSKEARQLEKVKKTFEEAYRNNKANLTNDTNYSISDAERINRYNELNNEIDILHTEFFENRQKLTEIDSNSEEYTKLIQRNDEIKEINKKNREELADIKDYFNKETERKEQERIDKALKEASPLKLKQNEIIQKTNPMLDDYHTGIRSVADILTWEEAMQNEENFSWGDFSREDAEKALKRGRITVYSSNPIKNGTFVSTSRQQAVEYAGGEGGRVYAKEVPLKNVAWISGDEGQYANATRYKLESENTKYSLSEDNKGNEIPEKMQKWAKDSKARDENGQLKVLYHGTATGEFTVFDKNMANPEGDWGAGFYLTDNEDDVGKNYEDGGPDFNNRISRLAEQIESEQDIPYDEAEKQAKEQLYKGSYKITSYVDVENPAIVGETYILDGSTYDIKDIDDYDGDLDGYYSDLIYDIVEDVQYNTNLYGDTSELSNLLYEATYDGGIEIQDLKNRINELYLENDEGQIIGNEVAREILEYLGYDGIIDPTVSTKWNMDMEEGTTHYIVFKPNQIKNITNQNPTDNPDINLSLSNQNEISPRNPNLTYGEDVRLESPVNENVDTVENNEVINNNLGPIAPEYKYTTMDDLEGFERQTQEEAQLQNAIKEFSKNPDVTVDEINKYLTDNFGIDTYRQFNEDVSDVQYELRNTRIYVAPYVRSNFADYYKDIQQKSFNKLKLTNDGQQVDQVYQELSSSYPNFFPEDIINEADQLQRIIEVSNLDRYTDMQEKVDPDFIREQSEFIYDSLQTYQETQRSKAADQLYKESKKYWKTVEPTIEDASNTDNFSPDRVSLEQAVENSMKDVEKQLGYSPKDPTKESTYDEIAQILTEEDTKPDTRNKRKWAIFKASVLDKGSVFEDLSLKSKNRELMGKWDYTLTSQARAQSVIGEGHTEFDPTTKTYKQTSKSLNDIRAEVDNTGLTKDFYNYMYHKHNVDRMNLEGRYEDGINKPVFGEGITSEISQQIVDEYETTHPEFMDYAKDVYDYVNADRQELVKEGVISQETADLWSEMYPHYVPIRRSGVDGVDINVPLDTRRTGVNAPIKKATGGSADILPLFDTMAMRTLQTYRATAKNSFGVELKNTLNTNTQTGNVDVDTIIDSIDNQDGLLQEGKNGKNPTFTVFENGEKVTYDITQDMYDALKPVSDSSFLSKTIKPLNAVSNFHRGVLTQYNLFFALTNAVKDAQDVLMNSQHAAKTYATVPEAVAQMATKGYWYQEYMKNGGEQNSYFDSQDNTFNPEKKGLAKATEMFPLKAISSINDVIEMTPRLSEYIASRKAGRSVEVAMLDAARVTTNFKAGGDFTKFLNRNGATFLNASVQGFNQQVRNIREANANGLKGWATLATKFAVAGLPALMLNALLWDDDDDYEELSDYVKQNYYVVAKYGDGQFIRIPKGRTLAVIQNAMEQVQNVITGDDEADLQEFINLFLNNLAPNNPIENNVLSPIIQAATNTAWYGGDLVPTRLQDLPAAEQYDESTDAFSKAIGEKINISPYKINYVLDQYTGFLGDMFLPMATQEAKNDADSIGDYLISPLKSKFTADSTMNNKNVGELYETSEELTTNAKKSNATDEDALKNKFVNSMKAEMNELYKQKREIQNSDLSKSEKYNQVREVQKQINALAKSAINNYEDVKITGNYAKVSDLEYHQYINSDGEEVWAKVNDKEKAALNEMNMDSNDKNNYFTAKNKISSITSTYKSNKEGISTTDDDDYKSAVSSLSTEKKTDIINTIKNSGLNDEGKAYLYDKYYASTDKLDIVVKTNIGMDNYLDLESQNFTADKDKDGKTISGSKKEKVFDYINSTNLDFEQKVLLAKMYYPSYDEYNNEIINYLNNDDNINYSEMEKILKTLGFTVSSDGTISWK